MPLRRVDRCTVNPLRESSDHLAHGPAVIVHVKRLNKLCARLGHRSHHDRLKSEDRGGEGWCGSKICDLGRRKYVISGWRKACRVQARHASRLLGKCQAAGTKSANQYEFYKMP